MAPDKPDPHLASGNDALAWLPWYVHSGPVRPPVVLSGDLTLP